MLIPPHLVTYLVMIKPVHFELAFFMFNFFPFNALFAKDQFFKIIRSFNELNSKQGVYYCAC